MADAMTAGAMCAREPKLRWRAAGRDFKAAPTPPHNEYTSDP
jgi:hypothetical protein